MGDQYFPLSSVILKAIADKVYDKRKVAATEIEKIVRSYSSRPDDAAVRTIINIIVNQTLVENQNTKKGMLMGLAGVAIGLGSEKIAPFIEDLTKHIFPCLQDTNANVRYYAAEALHNVCRAAKTNILPMFNDIFKVILALSIDTDLNVRGGVEVLDKGLRDIVSQSKVFDLVTFAPQLRDKMYLTNLETQNVVISWVALLHTLPEIDLLPLLPEIIDGLFSILHSTVPEVKEKAESVLDDFLSDIQGSPQKIKFTEIINPLAVHAQSANSHVKVVALLWIVKFIQLSDKKMLPFLSAILVAILPCASLEDVRSLEVKALADEASTLLFNLIQPEYDDPLNEELYNAAAESLEKAMEVLLDKIDNTENPCKLSACRWLYHLNDKLPKQMQSHVESMFNGVLKTMCDPSDEVVMLGLQVLAQISSSSFHAKEAAISAEEIASSQDTKLRTGFYFTKFMQALLAMFDQDRDVLRTRGQFIIRQLSVMLPVEETFWKLAELLEKEEDLPFASEMVQSLSLILLTTKELYPMRLKLRSEKDKENCNMFVRLYRSWCHNPVATLTLCLLSGYYQHAADIIHEFGNMDVTVDFLMDLDRLIQTIESPIFSFLRMKLLNPGQCPGLVETLYGILMLMPQTDSFQMLRIRLQCVPPAHHIKRESIEAVGGESIIINFQGLLDHFKVTTQKHHEYRREQMQERLKALMT